MSAERTRGFHKNRFKKCLDELPLLRTKALFHLESYLTISGGITQIIHSVPFLFLRRTEISFFAGEIVLNYLSRLNSDTCLYNYLHKNKSIDVSTKYYKSKNVLSLCIHTLN